LRCLAPFTLESPLLKTLPGCLSINEERGMSRNAMSFLRPWNHRIYGFDTFLAWPIPIMTSTCSNDLRSLLCLRNAVLQWFTTDHLPSIQQVLLSCHGIYPKWSTFVKARTYGGDK
jgi:hypothetical protein